MTHALSLSIFLGASFVFYWFYLILMFDASFIYQHSRGVGSEGGGGVRLGGQVGWERRSEACVKIQKKKWGGGGVSGWGGGSGWL